MSETPQIDHVATERKPELNRTNILDKVDTKAGLSDVAEIKFEMQRTNPNETEAGQINEFTQALLEKAKEDGGRTRENIAERKEKIKTSLAFLKKQLSKQKEKLNKQKEKLNEQEYGTAELKFEIDEQEFEITEKELNLTLNSLEAEKSITKDGKFKLATREGQNDFLLDSMEKMEEAGGLEKNGNKLSIFTFDVRGLKTVNDITKSHEKGDLYLERIAKRVRGTFIEKILKPIITKLSPDNVSNINFARDGGDEFSIAVYTEEPILNKEIKISELMALMPNDRLRDNISRSLGATATGDTMRLDKFLARALDVDTALETASAERGKLVSEGGKIPDDGILFTNEELTKRLGLEKLPEKYVFSSYVATGVYSFEDVMKDPLLGIYKKMDFGKLDEKDALGAKYMLLGALRQGSDILSYLRKAMQNEEWTHTDNELHRIHMQLMSRNDMTLGLVQVLQLEQARNKARGDEILRLMEEGVANCPNCGTQLAA